MEPATCRARSAERPQVPSELQRQPPSPGLSVASAPRAPAPASQWHLHSGQRDNVFCFCS